MIIFVIIIIMTKEKLLDTFFKLGSYNQHRHHMVLQSSLIKRKPMVDPKVKRLAFKVCFTNSKGCGVMITNHHLGGSQMALPQRKTSTQRVCGVIITKLHQTNIWGYRKTKNTNSKIFGVIIQSRQQLRVVS